MYIKLYDNWYDFTNYKEHPGGYELLKAYDRKDATILYNKYKSHNIKNIKDEYKIKDEKLLKKLDSELPCIIM